jgi:sterol desaturase/sphingolipid hydroxylase (fatty acid hydroxylase superfamily)
VDQGEQTVLQWALLFVVFLAVALGEYLHPRRALIVAKGGRWTRHGLLFLANSLTGRLLAFVIAIPAAALWSAREGFGLFHRVDLPIWAEAVVAIILLDFAIWIQHLALHKIPVLWSLHRLHHQDRDLDVTTALRFNPAELVLSIIYKSAWVALLGVPVAVVLAFEAWLNANALFNHGNVQLPRWLDRTLRLVLVTPDVHLVHHSTRISEQHSNFGFALTVWDRLFGTYVPVSADGVDGQRIGISDVLI